MKTNGKKIFAAVAVLCLVVALTALLVACTPKDRGGEGGGTVIAEGTPEQVAENPLSYTGQYVKRYLIRDDAR